MDKVGMEFKDAKEPAMVAGAALAACFIARKLTGTSLGLDSHNFAGAAKAFALITISGMAIKSYNKESEKL